MPPLAYPNGPNGAPNIGSASLPYNPVAPAASAAASSTPAAAPPGAGVPAVPPPLPPAGTDPNSPAWQDYLRRWDIYTKAISDAYAASSGWTRTQLEAQMDDAKKGRENAYKIAELSANTSRYGTDRNYDVQMAQLRQNQVQFEQNHGLEMAKAYTQYASTPDQVFAMNDFKSALGRVGQGFSPAPMAEQGSPKAKTYEDFAALTNYKSGGGGGRASASGGGATTDARLKAMKAVSDAMPPSDGQGHDEQDWAAIDAIKQLYFAGRPGEVERLGAPRRKIAQAGLARAGYDVASVENQRMRGLPGQGSVRAA